VSILLSAAGRSFLRAFGASLLILLPGILAAPNLAQVRGLATAAVVGSLAAGIRALQAFVPQLTIGGKYGPILEEGLRTLVAGFFVLALGALAAPNLAEGKAILVGGLAGIVAAAIRAIQGLLAPAETPNPNAGVVVSDSRDASVLKLG
jgi:hypothetical protein